MPADLFFLSNSGTIINHLNFYFGQFDHLELFLTFTVRLTLLAEISGGVILNSQA